MRASEFITESVQEVTLNDLYHNNYPDQDELIWNYVGKNDFDTQFTVRKINPLDLEEMLCDNYGVDDVQDLFKKMQPEQEDIVSNYQNDPTLSQKIIVTSGRRILDGNHRALAAVLANKPIKYIDVSEEQPDNVDEGLKDIAAAGIASLGLMGAPNLAAASTHAPPQTHTQAQTKAPAAPAAKAKTTAKTPAKSTVKTLSGHPDRETILHKAAAKAGLKGTELAQFLAQTKHESWDFGKLKERGTSDDFKKYDIRFNPDTARILGNTQAGDGERYCGRGFIQLTGRYNYRKAGEALNLPLEKKPELAARPDIAARIAVWFWKSRVKPHVDNFKDTTAVTKQINPGLMGLRSRKQNFLDYTHLLAKK